MAQTLDNLSYTWNASGTTFTGIKFNVTDTASASGSLLMDLQVGGVSKFKVDKSGNINIESGVATISAPTNGVSALRFNYEGVAGSHKSFALLNNEGLGVFGASQICFGGIDGSKRVFISSTVAGVLEQRNVTNAQTHRIYGTYTDGSNYRRLTHAMSLVGVAEIKPEGAGTGATGNVLHISGLPTSNPGPGILWNNLGIVNVGT